MKIVRYFDVWPNMKLDESIWLHDGRVERIGNSKRYRLEIEVPEPEADGTIVAVAIEQP